MNAVVQKDDYGCGVACIANVLEMSYEKALTLFGEDARMRAKTRGFLCSRIVLALKLAGLEYRNKYVPRLKKKTYKDGTIVLIKRSKRYPVGHYLSRKDGLWQDPWINISVYPRKSGTRKRLPGEPMHMILPV